MVKRSLRRLPYFNFKNNSQVLTIIGVNFTSLADTPVPHPVISYNQI
jgi:hypothetical protein